MPRKAPKGRIIRTRHHCKPLTDLVEGSALPPQAEESQQEIKRIHDQVKNLRDQQTWWDKRIHLATNATVVLVIQDFQPKQQAQQQAYTHPAYQQAGTDKNPLPAQAEKIIENPAYQQAGTLIDHPEAPVHTYYNESEGDDLHRWWLYNLEAT